jgi:hypothetical protein
MVDEEAVVVAELIPKAHPQALDSSVGAQAEETAVGVPSGVMPAR